MPHLSENAPFIQIGTKQRMVIEQKHLAGIFARAHQNMGDFCFAN
jgi:hypothetical protein